MNQRVRLSLLVVQVLVISLFFALLGRLFYLQVGAAPTYKKAALDIQSRDIIIPATRGLILDSSGVPLAMNKVGLAVTVNRSIIDKQPDEGNAVLSKVSDILGMDFQEVYRKTRLCGEIKVGDKTGCWTGNRFQPIPITKDADANVALRIVERPDRYPGIDAKPMALRYYPGIDGIKAAHVLGYVGSLSEEDLNKNKDFYRSETIGKDGLELMYDKYLRGRAGIKSVIVDRKESVTSQSQNQKPTPGNHLITSIDVRVQAAAEKGLALAVARARGQGFRADGGSAVVMDVKTGRILAIASEPTYDPNIWDKGLTVKQAKAMFSEMNGVPALFKPLQGLYAPASTFKAFSILAAVKAGYPLDATYDCPGSVKIGNRDFTNYESKAMGRITMKRAIAVSCDTVWYKIAYDQWLKDGGLSPKNPNDYFFKAAHEFQFDKKTGIDLPTEAEGRIPDRQWKQNWYNQNKDFYCNFRERAAKKDLTPFLILLAKENCIDGDKLRAGDAVNFSIGQGDTVITPLKLAQAYGAIANNGIIWQPTVAQAIVSPKGELIKQISPKKIGKVEIDPKTKAFLDDALHQVTTSGTAAGAFAGLKIAISGKTGTGEVFGLNSNGRKKDSTSWFASYGPTANPRYVVVMSVSQGGTGAAAAGVGVRVVWDALYGGAEPLFPSGPPKKLPKVSTTTKVLKP